MAKINAGCVVVTEFCRQGDSKFTGYINYIDREDAVRNENTAQYNLYQDYMGNPEKTTGLFTSDKDLTLAEKKELKSVFETAQKNGSLMWQTVISFDNRWLENNGLYNLETNILDEQRLKGVIRSAVGKMLHNEGLDNAVWSAAFHYNTGNLHAHIATVEPVPMREKKLYIQYDEVIKDGVKYKFPMLDENGQPIKEMEYKGRFKQESINICKREVVNQILNEKENNIKINKIIRESIVKQKKSFAKDEKLKNAFEELYRRMPNCNKNMWNYNNSIMATVRPMVDQLSDMYISEYHMEDFELLKDSLENQEIIYKEAYGNSGKSYSEGKIKELYERLGNAILKEVRAYDKNLKELENKHVNIDITQGVRTDTQFEIEEENQGVRTDTQFEIEEKEQGVRTDTQFEIEEKEQGVRTDTLEKFNDLDMEPEEYLQQRLGAKIHCEWSRKYREAKRLIYGEEKDYITAKELLEDEHYTGNVLATSDLGDFYKSGKGCEINNELAQQYYKTSLDNFKELYETESKYPEKYKRDIRSYYAYRIGKQYYYGQGTEQNYDKARNYFEKSETEYAKYNLGKMSYYGQGTEQNYDKAFNYFIQLSTDEKDKSFNAYACYKAANMIENNEVEYDGEEYGKLYEKALKSFLRMEKDDNLEYRIGMMYLQGKGTEVAPKLGEKYLDSSAKAGNVHAYYQLAKIYVERDNQEEVLKAVEYLKKAATKGKNAIAMYSLGNIYSSDREYIKDTDKAIEWYRKAEKAGNEFASYKLGKVFMEQGDNEKAIEQFDKCNNSFSLYFKGKLYLDREKGTFNFNKGIEAMLNSAQMNNSYAQMYIGIMHIKGDVINRNIDVAKRWLEQAMENGNEIAAEIRNDLDNNQYLYKGGYRQFAIGKTFIVGMAVRALRDVTRKQIEKQRLAREYELMQERSLAKNNDEID